MDFSTLKIEPSLKIEKVSPSFKFGGDKTNLSVDKLMINNVYMGTTGPSNPDLIATKVKELTSGPNGPTESKVSVIVGPYMGIVKSPEHPGTRVHLEFAITNEEDMPLAINGLNVRINKGTVHFKKFFKVLENSIRAPDFSVRFPIIINAHGACRLAVEFENIDQELIIEGKLPSQVFVLLGDKQVASKEFKIDVNVALWNTLNNLQIVADKEKSPLIYDTMIEI